MHIPLFSAWRWELVLRAWVCRVLLALGMIFGKLPPPRPPAPSFRKRINTTVSSQRGEIDLLFYTPADYQRRRDSDKTGARGHPAVVNFHGGGFTIGQASDDARWAEAVVRKVNAVVVCVEYRLAPEYPFPTAVEDGVDAVLYLVANSQELGINPRQIATSGFSAGGNLAFTVPLKLQEIQDVNNNQQPEGERDELHNNVMTSPVKLNPPLHPIVAIAAWYPVTDFATRRPPTIPPVKPIPAFFRELFDASYLYPPKLDLSDPCVSPGLAPVQMLRALPDHIILYTCEWDNLCVEAERLRNRLEDEAGKQVMYRKVPGVPHAWDKGMNPLKRDSSVDEIYGEACVALRLAFDVASHKF